MERLAPGDYTLRAQADQGFVGTARVKLRREGEGAEVAILVEEAARTLKGRAEWANGQPFRGLVWTSARRKGGLDTDLASAGPVETDAGGRFVLEGAPRGTLSISFSVPDLFLLHIADVTSSGDEIHVIVDEGFEVFSGRLLAAKDDRPVEGASILLTTSSKRRSARVLTSTNADGRFLLSAPAAVGGISAEASGFAPLLDVWPEVGEEAEFRLVRSARILGSVLAPNGESQNAVSVFARRVDGTNLDHWSARTQCDTDGSFLFRQAPPGRVSLFAFGNGWVSEELALEGGFAPKTREIEPGSETEIDLRVVPTGSALCRVMTDAGQPVTGVLVTAFPDGPRTDLRLESGAITGPDGDCVIGDLVPGQPYVFSTKPPRELPVQSEPVRVVGGEIAYVGLEVSKSRWVKVRVIDVGSGHAIPGATVTVWSTDHSGVRRVLRTGMQGEVEAGPFPRTPLVVSVSAPGYTFQSDLNVPLPDDGKLPTLNVSLRQGQEVSGRVTWSDGSPRRGIYLDLIARNGSYAPSTGVSADGSFRFDGVPQGDYEIRVQGRPELGKFAARAGETGILIVTPQAPPLRSVRPILLRILGPGGTPVRTARVRSFTPPGTEHSVIHGRVEYRLSSNEKVDELAFEVYDAISSAGMPLGGGIIGPFDAASSEIRIDLPPGVEIAGEVVSGAGIGIPGLEVRAFPESRFGAGSRPHARSRSGPDGSFHIGGLGKGKYRIETIVPPDRLRPPVITVSAPAQGLRIEVQLAASVEVTVQDWLGRSVPFAEVQATGPSGDARTHARAGTDGVARVSGLNPRDSYVLLILPPKQRRDLLPHRDSEWSPKPTLIRLDRGYGIRGTIVNTTGARIRALVYYGHRAGAWIGFTPSRADGSFEIGMLTQENVWLCATLPGRSPPDGEAGAHFRAGAEETIRITVQE